MSSAINISDIDHNTMVLFKQTSCSYCQGFQPTWDELIEKNYKLYTIDCEEREDYCKLMDIYKFPTIVYKIDDRPWEKYEGEKEIETLAHFLNTYIVDGCLQDEALCDENELDYMKYLEQLDELEELVQVHNTKITGIQDYFHDKEKKLQEEYKLLVNNQTDLLLTERKNFSYIRKVMNKREV
jgi:thioredoxin-like negative regulator of GroEL